MSKSREIDPNRSAIVLQWQQSPAGQAMVARSTALYQRYNLSADWSLSRRRELIAAMGEQEAAEARHALFVRSAWPIPEPHSAHGNPPLFRYSEQELIYCLETILAGPLVGRLVGRFRTPTFLPEAENEVKWLARQAQLRALMQQLGTHSPQALLAKLGEQETALTLMSLQASPHDPIVPASTQTPSKPA